MINDLYIKIKRFEKHSTQVATFDVIGLILYLAVEKTAKPVWLPFNIFFTGQLEDLQNGLPKHRSIK